MKQILNIYIEKETIRKLDMKANEAGFHGRGARNKYITKIANEVVIFVTLELAKELNKNMKKK